MKTTRLVLHIALLGVMVSCVHSRHERLAAREQSTKAAIAELERMNVAATAILARMDARKAETRRLIEAGEICVTFDDKMEIANHWKPRVDLGIEHCPEKDFPAGVKEGDVGMLDREKISTVK